MKKLLVVLLALALMVSTTVYAATDFKECTIALTVPTDFYLYLGPAWIDFGTVIEGQFTGEKNLVINTVSTTGNDWELRFQNTALTDGTNTIANTNCYMQFTEDGSATGASTLYATKAAFPVVATDAVLYDSGANETGNLSHTAVLSVDVPTGQASGTYLSVIKFTMIET